MSTHWDFLYPWYATLHHVLHDNSHRASNRGMYVRFEWMFGISEYPRQQIYLMLRLEKENAENVNKLKQIREAIEIFTMLAEVNQEVFMDQFSNLMQTTVKRKLRNFPQLIVSVFGATTRQQATWSRLLEWSDSSPQFQEAIQTLKAMRQEETDKETTCKRPSMTWKCNSDYDCIEAILSFDKSDGVQIDLRRLFTAGASIINQLSLGADSANLVDIFLDQRQQMPMSIYVRVIIVDLATPFCRDLCAGLVSTPIDHLDISLYGNTTNDGEATINAGVLLNRVYRWSRVVSETRITCHTLSLSVVAAICSTIAVQVTTTPIFIIMEFESSKALPWPWMVYAIGCSPSTEMGFDIQDCELAKADIVTIANVLRYNYPLPKGLEQQLPPATYDATEFGYVDITEGTAVWLIDLEEDSRFVVQIAARCRAWFKEDYVEVIVPGTGLCRSRIGDGVYEVSRDSEEQNVQRTLSLRSLSMVLTFRASVSLVMSFLKLIGQNLQSLRLTAEAYDTMLDLSVLSAVCPNLGSLETCVFDVVVSEHNEVLCRWPIRTIKLQSVSEFSGLTLCLQSPKLRMARELENISIPFYRVSDKSLLRDLKAHDGDYLFVTKEKFPIQSKAALISVVNAKALHQLHTEALELICVFASTPAQRTVNVPDLSEFWEDDDDDDY